MYIKIILAWEDIYPDLFEAAIHKNNSVQDKLISNYDNLISYGWCNLGEI